jgi:hypothetical protein
VTRKAETPVDWFDFLFETYQHTSKEKLLELLASMPDCDELAKQSQRDLAITYFVKVFYTYIQCGVYVGVAVRTRMFSTMAVGLALSACAGRDPQPIATVQPQDAYSDCTMIRAEIEANNAKATQLADEQGLKVAQNVGAGVVGLVIWPLWFADRRQRLLQRWPPHQSVSRLCQRRRQNVPNGGEIMYQSV